MKTTLKTWGNSQGIRIPKEVLEDVGFHLNDVLDIEVKKDSLVITKKFKHKTLEERAAEYGGKLNLSEEIDWGDPVGDEVW